jgi:HAD superfamily 5'-nucleotidase-like hydrolase
MLCPMEAKVYVNRTLNLRKIRYLGFDMDHTLVRYDSRAFEKTTQDIVLAKLVAAGYPEEVLKLPFDYDLAIRGLVIDKKMGNLLKISRHGAIRAAYHGVHAMDFSVQKKTYSSTYIDLRDSARYSSIDTAFSISTANLFMQLVDLKDRSPGLKLPDYETMGVDLMLAVDASHRDGSLKGEVRKNLAQYIVKDEAVVRGLERFKRHDKKLFVLTNSDFHYTKLLLDYAINPFLKDHKDWSELFEIVITFAAKPRFFVENTKFLKVNAADGTMTNYEGKLTPGIYQGGCASIFTRDLDLDGDDILYIGDHIYGDILRLKKDCNWRTAMVVEDLEEEVRKYREVAPIQKQINTLMEAKEPLEEEYVDLVSTRVESGANPEQEARIHELQHEIGELDKLIADQIRKHQSHFNKYWGEVMRAGNEESYFDHQTERFACIYMGKLGDLTSYSPRTYFRAPRRPMAHEIQGKIWNLGS